LPNPIILSQSTEAKRRVFHIPFFHLCHHGHIIDDTTLAAAD
jgi:hypothetical protein